MVLLLTHPPAESPSLPRTSRSTHQLRVTHQLWLPAETPHSLYPLMVTASWNTQPDWQLSQTTQYHHPPMVTASWNIMLRPPRYLKGAISER